LIRNSIFILFTKLFFIEAEAAQQALNGRWFGGRTIQCQIYDDIKYKEQDYTA